MGMTATDYASQLQALLPPGAAWRMEPGDVRLAVLEALAEEFARLDARADALPVEANPRTSTELLPEWEAFLGLPPTGTDAERRGAILGWLLAQFEQNAPFYIAQAAALGVPIPITITKDWVAFRVGASGAGDLIGGQEWEFIWTVHAPLATSAELRARLEALFTKFKQAHSIVYFIYE
jgi:uncharacterized protein YmfQ (DUF2313 family)